MAEILVYVVERLRVLLSEEAFFLYGVQDEVVRLQNELNRMLSFLKDADQSVDLDERMRSWVADIRNIAYDAEDVVDSYISNEANRRVGCYARTKELMCIIDRGTVVHNLGNKVQELNKRILDITQSRQSYGIRNIGDQHEASKSVRNRLREVRKTSSHEYSDDVVGLEDDKRLLVDELLDEHWERTVVTISGMGGIGKTTLAQKIFNAPDIKGSFDFCAWVCVSEEYRLCELLQRIIKSFKKPTLQEMEAMEKMDEDDLEDLLRKFLQKHRYLLVLDDVWHREVLETLRRALPDDENGSRVIVTTRNKRVSFLPEEKGFLHELRFLTEDESWKLFCNKASPVSCPDSKIFDGNPTMEKLGREMVAKCGGLPLAVVVLAGLLSRKQAHEWTTVKNHIWRHVARDSNYVARIIELSFHDLPSELKPCFLYFSLFPEDHTIRVQKLVQLWVAEGFIVQGDEVMEDLAEEYLTELIDRNMIQEIENLLGRTMTCKVHDILRDLAVQKARESNFLDIYKENIYEESHSIRLSFRRQAVHTGTRKYISLDHSNSNLRSIMLFNLDQHIFKPEHLAFIYRSFKLVRVLDLEDIKLENSGKVDKIPDSVGELIHLRYLSLRNGSETKLPPSIGKLGSLQTLVATGNYNWKFPREICKLTQLRHLVARFSGHLHVNTLIQLQTLKYMNFEQWMRIDVPKLSKLRELEIHKIVAPSLSIDSLTQLKNLQSLTLQADNSFPPLPRLSHSESLFKLKLEGKIGHLDEKLNQLPPVLRILYLKRTKLRQDPMQILGRLPNLTILVLADNAYVGKEMICTERGFPKLESLRLSWLETLMILSIDDESMPKIRSFSMEDCIKLTEVPQRLRTLPICCL